MSILLQALRKSEEQRQLGQAPSIHSPSADGPASTAPGPAWIPAVLVAVSALAMAWFGWEQYRAPDTLTNAASQPALAEAAAPTGQEALEPEGMPANEAASHAPAADSEGDSTRVRKPGLIAAPSGRTPVESFQAEDAAQTPGAAAAAPPGRPRGSRANQAVREYTAAPGGSPPAAVSGSSSPDTPGTNDMAAVPTADASGERVAAAPHQPEPITYWELPQSVRDSMPEMRITVLVYAEQPENRFLLIGGQRLLEGEEFESGMLLQEIRRGGAVFVYRNYRFLVKG